MQRILLQVFRQALMHIILFIGLPNATDYKTDWDTDPPSPKDNFDEENNYWDTTIALKKINNSDVRQVVQKRQVDFWNYL